MYVIIMIIEAVDCKHTVHHVATLRRSLPFSLSLFPSLSLSIPNKADRFMLLSGVHINILYVHLQKYNRYR